MRRNDDIVRRWRGCGGFELFPRYDLFRLFDSQNEWSWGSDRGLVLRQEGRFFS